MPLYIVGIAIAIGFALLLWRQHKSGAGWQREVSFLVDLIALSATALVVGVLVVAQLTPSEEETAVAVSPDAESTPIAISTKAIENEPVVATETGISATLGPELTATTVDKEPVEEEPEATATATPKLTATTVEEEPEATATAKASPTIELNITATSTLIPRATIEPTPSVIIYTVRAGDTFGLIAQDHDLTVEELLAANPGVTPERIGIGDELIIPPPQEDESATTEEESESEDETDSEDEAEKKTPTATVVSTSRTHTVQAGDTLSQIAQRYGVTMDAIIRANPTMNADSLKLNEELTIPPPERNRPTPASQPNQYIVREGDTFGLIAQRFGLSVSELSDYNPRIDPDRLSVGDTIYIP